MHEQKQESTSKTQANALNAALHSAISEGDTAQVEALLNRGADPNARNKNGTLPLTAAIYKGLTPIIALLLAKNADPNAAHPVGGTHLHTAVRCNQVMAAEMLLHAGAQIDAVNLQGNTPLSMAADLSTCLEITHFLLKRGADPAKADLSGDTPLHIATRSRNRAAAEILIDKSADLNATNGEGKTPLFIAIEIYALDLAKHLLEKGADPDKADQLGHTPLHIAAQDKNVDAVEILARYAQGNAVDNAGKTPLHYAICSGHVPTAHSLIHAGVRLDVVDQDGDTLLHTAVSEGHIEMVRLLIEQGADINQVTAKGYSALFYAVKKGHIEVVHTLLQAGADIDVRLEVATEKLEPWKTRAIQQLIHAFQLTRKIQNLLADNVKQESQDTSQPPFALSEAEKNLANQLIEVLTTPDREIRMPALTQDMLKTLETTPIHNATLQNICIHVRNHLKKESCTSAEDKQHRTAEISTLLNASLSSAISDGDTKQVKSLLDAGADPNKGFPLHTAMYKDKAICEALLVHNANPNQTKKNGQTPLHVAARCNQVIQAKMLLNAGAQIDARDKEGHTPLSVAIQSAQLDIAKRLLEEKADPDIADQVGNTALHFAANDNNLAAVKMLIDHGADLNIADTRERTPLSNAISADQEEVVQFLLKRGADPNYQTSHGISLLHLAVRLGYVDIAKMLIDHGANLHKVHSSTSPVFSRLNGWTALHLAAHTKNVAAVTLLLNARAPVDAATPAGETPLLCAALTGCPETVDLLIRRGADVKQITYSAGELYTPLMAATNEGHVEVVSVLLRAGAKIDMSALDTSLKTFEERAFVAGMGEEAVREKQNKIRGLVYAFTWAAQLKNLLAQPDRNVNVFMPPPPLSEAEKNLANRLILALTSCSEEYSIPVLLAWIRDTAPQNPALQKICETICLHRDIISVLQQTPAPPLQEIRGVIGAYPAHIIEELQQACIPPAEEEADEETDEEAEATCSVM